MRDQVLKSVRALAALLPMLALTQPLAAQREDYRGPNRVGSWEFSVSVGFMDLDGGLGSYLGSQGFSNAASPSSLVPAAVGRLGYNISDNLGVSIGTGYASGSGVNYLTPFAAATYTLDLNAKLSPFLTGGTQFTRITGNGGIIHPTWGAHVGLGVRQMVSDYLAVRLEGRLAFEHYAELGQTADNPVVTLGLSYFTAGHHRRPPPAPCPVCAGARVDTVWRTVPPPPPPPPHKCENGVAPEGARTDEFGCLILPDTLLLEGVHFDFDKSEITPRAKLILDRVAQSMLAHPELFFEIAGHTDSVGTFDYNYLLSARRARAVRDYLIQQGVPEYRMTAVGYGEWLPIAPNATVEGRALNRRGIEIRVKKSQ